MSTALKVSTFRERFAELYNDSEKTMKDLSAELHVSNQTISAWKVGTRSPKEPTIIAIANHFNVSVQWLMGFDVPKYDIKLDLGMFNGSRSFPVTSEARILASGIDQLPEEERKKALAVVQAMFTQYADYFDKGDKHDA